MCLNTHTHTHAQLFHLSSNSCFFFSLVKFGSRNGYCLAPSCLFWALLVLLQVSDRVLEHSLKQSDSVLSFLSRIEETWRLWQKFLDDFSRFEDWLKCSERVAAFPSSSGVLYTVAKDELKKFEVIFSFKYFIFILLRE